ncbi:S1 family peptidase [Streptomyces acidiscabies]|uniref:Serine protease n=2 Tax=Actinomycetes TaxID=1760 RepID=A0AAP6BKA5_9ACTN|nr:serine protease [Streptomyces acidiscabies]MBP5937242.1 trypsin-like peptidase domain-containing protein [Streptomyces sp. LBUM 1476]MBZ3914702.1 trypsin-like peptidase domain-containing protein [Streptomyces acidiscabies]MDX2966145.1 serine protease [Streptomyces acidiscabies]MDX3020616.1 serine protease [Streptomyces acidiscabies]MDX3795823.1 serine protease [Streptomyces acidiscabies]
MRKPLVAAFFALALAGVGAAPAVAAPDASAATVGKIATAPATAVKAEAAPALKAVTLAGTVALSNCSGSVIRFPNSLDTDPALVMSNGHCLTSGFLDPGEVVVNQASSRTFGLLNSAGTQVATLRASKIAYATMTDTDVSIYQLTSTYATIRNNYGIAPLTVQNTHPTVGTAITVASGYWKRLYSCNVDGFVYRLKEGDWTWKDSLRYTSACQTIGGTSGSPVVDQATGNVVAVNNTGNEDGAQCTVNNPCEVTESGTVTVRKGINYAQETYQIPACFTTGNQLNLNASGCILPKP